MTTKLLAKELRLAAHPTSLIFLALSAMLLIPNYPYLVTFFYTGLGIFFTCLGGRENHDVAYSVALPVRKSQVVKARVLFVAGLELLQLLLALPFAWLRSRMPLPGNLVGMDANLAFFGLALGLLGLFNLVFFGVYYRDVRKVGKAFALSSLVVFLYISLVEAACHVLPLFRDRLDRPDPEEVGLKLIVLGLGAAAFAGLTLLAYLRGRRDFERQDL